MGGQDRVVRALVTAIATLEDLVKLVPETTMPLSTLEEVAYELGEMAPAERQAFLDALTRIAAEDPQRAAWIAELPQNLGISD